MQKVHSSTNYYIFSDSEIVEQDPNSCSKVWRLGSSRTHLAVGALCLVSAIGCHDEANFGHYVVSPDSRRSTVPRHLPQREFSMHS